MFAGRTILPIAESRVGQRYVLGARVPMSDGGFSGPWDCAEFVSWSVYQAYGTLVGVRPPDPLNGDAYTGYWAEDSKTLQATVDVATAIATPGAILLRRPRVVRPGEHAIGHVAISRGDGTTVEARGRLYGVCIATGAAQRVWDTGVLVPGVDYAGTAPASAAAASYLPPADYLQCMSPFMRGPRILAAQRALKEQHCSPGPLDGVFGGRTEDAVYNFQAGAGVATDGVIGPETAKMLGLAWPILPTSADTAAYAAMQRDDASRVAGIALRSDAGGDARPGSAAAPEHFSAVAVPDVGAGDVASFDVRPGAVPERPQHWATLRDGSAIYLGTETEYTDDMVRRGLFLAGSMAAETGKAGHYDRVAAARTLGPMAHIIFPTAMAESRGSFACLNSYDRAAFTYGFYQAAAHTPDLNLIVLFRMLLALPLAPTFFPDLSLGVDPQGRRFVQRTMPDGTTASLERAEDVTRPNGKVETQLAAFMRYLNADPLRVDDGERTAVARLFLWMSADGDARSTQVRHAIQTARGHIRDARAKVPGFDPNDWRQVVWVNDILHQGRAGYSAIEAALASPEPLKQLSQIGAAHFEGRLTTVANAIAELDADGSLSGWAASDLGT